MEPHFIDNEERQRLRAKIEKEVSAMGYPPEFGTALAAGLGTERAMGKCSTTSPMPTCRAWKK